MATKNFILSADTARKKMQRMAYEIVERNMDEQQIVIAGIKDTGVREKYPVCAKQAIEPDLQHFYIDDDEACINYKVHEGNQGIAKHFLLSQSQQQ